MKRADIFINVLLFLGFSVPPLVAEYLTAKPGNVPGTGFDVLCYEPFDYAYFLLALAVFVATNIQIARKQKKPIRRAALFGGVITVVWFVSCFMAVGGMHLELGGRL